MKNCIYAEQFLQNGSWRQNVTVHCENGRIAWIEEGKHPDAVESFAYLTPGLVDNHIHGGDGVSAFGSSVEEIESWLVKLAEAGTAGRSTLSTPKPLAYKTCLRSVTATDIPAMLCC